MGRIATDSGGTFAAAPAGTHVARCVEIIDLGTQHGEYEGKPNVREQVIVRWELPNETIQTDGGEAPMLVSKFYTVSLGEKATMRKDFASWRGRDFTDDEKLGFDIMNILDKACLVTVTHNAKGKAVVASVSGMVKGMTCPPAHNKPKAFWISEWDDNAFQALPEGFRNIIAESDEYKAAFTPPAPNGQARDPLPAGCDEEDIPF